MSNEMRKLIDLVEEAQINSYLDRLKLAETQEEFESIISEAELYEAPGMVDKIKKGAKTAGLIGLGALSTMGAMADEPASADPGADPYAPQQVQHADPHYQQLQTKYPYAFGSHESKMVSSSSWSGPRASRAGRPGRRASGTSRRRSPRRKTPAASRLRPTPRGRA